jgi:hypothetical protein
LHDHYVTQCSGRCLRTPLLPLLLLLQTLTPYVAAAKQLNTPLLLLLLLRRPHPAGTP